jgi:hypothetical protein
MTASIINNGIALNNLASGSYVLVIRENDKIIVKESFIKK